MPSPVCQSDLFFERRGFLVLKKVWPDVLYFLELNVCEEVVHGW